MKRVMTKTTKGSPNGISVIEYLEGETYDLPESLAVVFDSIGVCKPLIPAAKKEPEEKPEAKMVEEVPSNKMASVPSNKKVSTKRRKE